MAVRTPLLVLLAGQMYLPMLLIAQGIWLSPRADGWPKSLRGLSKVDLLTKGESRMLQQAALKFASSKRTDL